MSCVYGHVEKGDDDNRPRGVLDQAFVIVVVADILASIAHLHSRVSQCARFLLVGSRGVEVELKHIGDQCNQSTVIGQVRYHVHFSLSGGVGDHRCGRLACLRYQLRSHSQGLCIS